MALNRERLRQVADRIERLGKGEPIDGLSGFSMGEWWYDEVEARRCGEEVTECGTVGCIAGSVFALRIEEGKEAPGADFFDAPSRLTDFLTSRGEEQAMRDLGLTELQGEALFCRAWEDAGTFSEITAAEAAQALRDIADGRLVWKRMPNDCWGGRRYGWRRA